MIPNRLSDLVAIAPREPAALPALRSRLPTGAGWVEAAAPPGWLVALHGFGAGTVPERPPFVLEGWPDLHRWRGNAQAGHDELTRLAESRRWSAVPGDVGYAHLLPGGEAALVRAPAARVPIYVHRSPDALLVTTRMDLMLGLRPEWPWAIDGLVLLSFCGAAGVLPPGRTTTRDVRLVPAGHVLEIGAGGSGHGTPSRYWDPRPASLPRRFDEHAHAEALREAVLDHLRVELDADGRNLLKLSMGVDSSTLAVLTGRELGLGYSAVSYLPLNPIDRAAEDGHIATLAGVAPPERHFRRHLDAEAWLELLRRPGTSGMTNGDPALLELPALLRDLEVRTLFGGEGADAVCGDRMTVPDWLAEAPVTRVLRHQARLPVGEKEVLHALAQRALRRLPLESQIPGPGRGPAAATAELRREFDAWDAKLLTQGRAERGPRLRLWYGLQMEEWLLQNWEVLGPLRIRRATPFYQRRVLELALSAPPQALIGPHVKKPLRRAFAGDVPAPLLWRDKGLWAHEPDPPDRPWASDLPEELAGVVREDWLPRPSGPLDYGDRLALASLEQYAFSVRALRASLESSEKRDL